MISLLNYTLKEAREIDIFNFIVDKNVNTMDLRVMTLVVSIFLAVGTQAQDRVSDKRIKCHVCNGHTQAQCNDPFFALNDDGEKVITDGFLDTCPQESTMCRKIYQDVRGDIKMFRSCASVEYKDKGKNACYKTVMEEYNTYVCTCDEDGCNGAEKIHMPSILMIVLSVLFLALFKH